VSPPAPVVLVELATLGVELARPDGRRLAAFRPDPGAARRLEELAPHARLAAIASDPDLDPRRAAAALAGCKLDACLDPELPVATGAPEAVFARVLEGLGAGDPQRPVLYVGADPTRRLRAAVAGLVPVPHLLLARPVLAGDTLRHVRLGGSEKEWPSLLREQRVVPLLRTRRPEPTLYAVAASSTLEMLATGPTRAQPLPGEPGTQTLYLLQVTPEEVESSRRLQLFLAELARNERICEETPEGFLLCLPGDVSVDDVHPPDAGHGHTRVALPGLGLLQAAVPTSGLALRSLEPWERTTLAGLDAALLEELWAPAAGQAPVDVGTGPVLLTSRHVEHPHNETATAWLGARLQEICGLAWRVPFGLLSGRTLSNLQADIPGTTDELVILAAHFDSTAANTSGYPGNEATQPAPGGDDDASGVAGVLAAARVLEALAKGATPHRSLRFLLFNAEEQGLVGSRIYAEQLKSSGQAQVAAVIQLDMIGWRSGSPTPALFEIHGTGQKDHALLHAPAGQLAAIVKSAAAEVSPSLAAQVHPLPDCDFDPAAHRSDHESFLVQGWPACLVAEDLWAEVCASPAQTGNPAYHTAQDVAIDRAYAADVARAAAAAAWILARPTAAPGAPGGGESPGGRGSRVPPSPPAPNGSAPVPSRPGPTPGPIPTPPPTPGGPSPMPDPGPMPDVFLVEFLARWIRDEDFRCQILHREIDGLTDFGLNGRQRAALLSLDRKTILERLAVELEHFYHVNLDKVRGEVGGPIVEAPGSPIAIDAPLGGGSPPAGVPAPGSAPATPGGPPPASELDVGHTLLALGRAAGATTAGGATAGAAIAFSVAGATVYDQGQVHVRGTDVPTATRGEEEIIVVLGQGFDASPEVRFERAAQVVDAEILGIHCGVDLYQRVTIRVTLGETGRWTVRARNAGDPEWSTELVQIMVNE